MCCTSFTSQLSKGKTAADRKCSTATPRDTYRKISKCPFHNGLKFASDSCNAARVTIWVCPKSISQRLSHINLMQFFTLALRVPEIFHIGVGFKGKDSYKKYKTTSSLFMLVN